MAYDFFNGIFWLITGWFASGLDRLLDKASITRRPRWLGKVLRQAKLADKSRVTNQNQEPDMLEFWLLSDEGELSLPKDNHVDVEVETKKRLQMASDGWGEEEEQKLDSNLYSWWKHGGWWGERDESGDYAPPFPDDDTTSVISLSTTASDAGWTTDDHDSDSNSDSNSQPGNRTPTQQTPHPHPYPWFPNREDTPPLESPLSPTRLARLLDPHSAADRHEARLLAQHLSADRPLTRSHSRRLLAADKAHVLTSTRFRPADFPPRSPSSATKVRLSPDEEERLLEHLILSRRARSRRSRSRPRLAGSASSAATMTTNTDATNADATEDPSSWKDGADGLGSGGPQCVVCQSAPRTILAWPCRCLSVCEDCRVSLAMTNFATCVCCRQDVGGFSRLFVP